MEKQFRFQDFDIWKKAADLNRDLFSLADKLEGRKRGATLSITNNIAEGSGSVSKADFANFLNTSRRSVFEVANILLILSRNGYVESELTAALLRELEQESRMILAFMRSLR